MRVRPQQVAVRHRTWPQVLLVGGAVGFYFTARGLAEADPSRAVDHAHDVVAFERSAGVYLEPALQEAVVPHDRLVTVLNWIYIWGHWPVIIAVLVWLLRCHRGPYRLLRDALFVSGIIGLVIFTLFPVAPPRLAGLGMVDTVTLQSHSYRVLQPPSFVNQYAAVPSLHVGWNLLVGLFVFRHSRRLVLRAVGIAIPVGMAAAVVLTANHYVIDGVLGALVALVGLAVAGRIQRRSEGPGRRPGDTGPSPLPRELTVERIQV